jgi:hypothetical protein
MPIPDDTDVDRVISRLAGPLEPAAREAFRQAAEEALAHIPHACWGEGLAYRVVAILQRQYFDPPDDRAAGWDIGQEVRTSKLKQASPIEHVRYRRQER